MIDKEKVEQIMKLTLQRLEIPEDCDKANFEQLAQMLFIKELNSLMGLGILMIMDEPKLIETIRAYLDMIELCIKEA